MHDGEGRFCFYDSSCLRFGGEGRVGGEEKERSEREGARGSGGGGGRVGEVR